MNRMLPWIAIAILTLGSAGCGKHNAANNNGAAQPGTATVDLTGLGTGDLGGGSPVVAVAIASVVNGSPDDAPAPAGCWTCGTTYSGAPQAPTTSSDSTLLTSADSGGSSSAPPVVLSTSPSIASPPSMVVPDPIAHDPSAVSPTAVPPTAETTPGLVSTVPTGATTTTLVDPAPPTSAVVSAPPASVSTSSAVSTAPSTGPGSTASAPGSSPTTAAAGPSPVMTLPADLSTQAPDSSTIRFAAR